MGVADSGGRADLSRQRHEPEVSPERTKVWTEPRPKKVPVVYYLSRSGQLEHPHFMEISLTSSHGLYLRDVLNRLDFLRGKGMASLYSWSSKRCYKNGYVWHDLSEEDLISPAHGHEYVLKGSELLRSCSSSSSSCSEKSIEISKSVKEVTDFPPGGRKKTPWSSLDLPEYKVYKNDCTAETSGKAAHAATQTDDMRRMRRHVADSDDRNENPTELGLDDISPPQSSSSPETVDSFNGADMHIIADTAAGGRSQEHEMTGSCPSGRLRASASAMLMHLISCGSFSLVPEYSGRLPCGGVRRKMDGVMDATSFSAIRLEDREYISGSLIETKKKTHCGSGGGGTANSPVLQRSSSFNGDRSTAMEEADGVRAKCLKVITETVAARDGSPVASQNALGSKRF